VRKAAAATRSRKGYWGTRSMSETVFSSMPTISPCTREDKDEQAQERRDDIQDYLTAEGKAGDEKRDSTYPFTCWYRRPQKDENGQQVFDNSTVPAIGGEQVPAMTSKAVINIKEGEKPHPPRKCTGSVSERLFSDFPNLPSPQGSTGSIACQQPGRRWFFLLSILKMDL